MAFPYNEFLALFDVGIFVRCSEAEQRRRIIARHMAAWGWDEARAADRACNNDLPNGRFVDANSQLEAACVEIVESTPGWQSEGAADVKPVAVASK